MKELYQSPELDILCLRAAERLAEDKTQEYAGVVNNRGEFSYGQNDFTGDNWIEIPL